MMLNLLVEAGRRNRGAPSEGATLTADCKASSQEGDGISKLMVSARAVFFKAHGAVAQLGERVGSLGSGRALAPPS
jgi:hypothetical protein